VIRQLVDKLKSIKIAGLVLAIGLAFFLFASTSQASCGDYSMPGKSHFGDIASSHSSSANGYKDLDHLPTKGPCHGPNCSKGSDQIPAAPTTITTHIRNQDLIPLTTQLLEEDRSITLFAEEDVYPTLNCTSGIERPPRFFSL
jgi:hypothetical protein